MSRLHDDARDGCPIDKAAGFDKRRRTTGGILTCVLSCGFMADWMEMWRGEQLELVYAFLLQFYKDLYNVGIFLKSLGYDNACKLLTVARRHQDRHLPWPKSFVEDVAIVLDNFHRRNHTLCVKSMPEVDPLDENNAVLLSGKTRRRVSS